MLDHLQQLADAARVSRNTGQLVADDDELTNGGAEIAQILTVANVVARQIFRAKVALERQVEQHGRKQREIACDRRVVLDEQAVKKGDERFEQARLGDKIRHGEQRVVDNLL